MAFTLGSVGHAFAAVFHGIAKGAKEVEKVLILIAPSAAVVESITALVPGIGAAGVELERAAYAVLGQAVGAVHAAGAAADANGLNVQLDQEFVADLKALIANFKPQLIAAGVIKDAAAV